MENDNEEEENEKQEFKVLIMDIKDKEFEEFQNTINKELIIQLYSIFQIFEKKGIINYEIYFESMTQVFKKYNKSKDFKYIFDLIFNRFQKIKCTLKNNKTVFYLIDMVYKNAIETYIIPCFLTLLLKCPINDKIKILFQLTDNDEDGFLNKDEIKLMISTINFLYCENSENNINSSIITQSLMNIKVKEKINKLMNEPGGLGSILQKEKYVNFDDFFKCLEKIPNYKYEIIPCFINIKKCLYNQRKEKIIEVKNQNKKEFIRVSSALSNLKLREHLKSSKVNSSVNLDKLIKNIKIKKEKEENKTLIMNESIIKQNNLLLGKKEKNKSLKELLKESTIFADRENYEDMNKRKLKKKNPYKNKLINSKYIFEADFDNIKKLEVEPALLRFSNNNFSMKRIKRYNSNYDILNSNTQRKNIFKKLVHKNTFDPNNNIYYRNFKSAKNNKFKTKNLDFFKKRSILQLNYKNDIIENMNQNMNFNFTRKHNKSVKNITFSKGALEKILENKKTHNIINKNNTNKINNKTIYKKKFIRFNTPINRFKFKEKINLKLRNDLDKLIKSSESTKNKPKESITNLKNLTFDKVNSPLSKSTFNQTFNKPQNKKSNINKDKYSFLNSRINRYLNIQEILKDLADEERLTRGKTLYLEKELASLYNKLAKERSDVKDRKKKFNEDDFSLNFYDLNEKLFPDNFGKKMNCFQKLNLNN